MSFIVGAFLELAESAGLAVGSTVAEVSGSEALGTAAGGAVKGSIIERTQEAITSGFNSAIDAVFGENAAENIEQKLSEAVSLTSTIAKQGTVPILDQTTFEQQVVEKHEQGHSINQQTTIEDQCDYSRYNMQKKSESNVNPYNMTPAENVVEGITSDKSPYQRGKDLGQVLSISSNYAINNVDSIDNRAQFEKEMFSQITTLNPSLSYIVNALFRFDTGIAKPVSAQYQEIAKTFNGRRKDGTFITKDDVVQGVDEKTGRPTFSCVDEIGITRTWYPKDYIVIRPIWGVFVGINSPNDRLPIDLLDTYCMFHDIDYQDNRTFHLESDLKLISRISQNIQRMDFAARPAAKTALSWFTYMAPAVSRMAGNAEITIGRDRFNLSGTRGRIRPQSNVKTKSIYNQPEQDDTSIFPIIVTEPQYQNPESKNDFFQGLSDGIEEESIQTGLWSLNNSVPNPLIVEEVRALEITLL